MSDIIAGNKDLAQYCEIYIKECESLSTQIDESKALEHEENASKILNENRLHIRLILQELQIIKIQQTFLQTKVLEKQILILRNRFAKIITNYQKVFIPHMPSSLQEISKRLELIGMEWEAQWLNDLRMLGLALSLLENFTQKSNSFMVVLNYQYQFCAILRNSIMCKKLRAQLGEDNLITNLRSEQISIFYQFAESLIAKQRTIFARTQSIDSLSQSIRITQGLVELGFITESQFFDTEYYKKQDEALSKLLIDTKEALKK